MSEPFDTIDDGGALPLGATIEFEYSGGAKPLDPVFLQPGRHGSGHVKHCFQTGKIVATADLVRQSPDPVHHGWHEVDPLNLVRFDQAQGFLCIELDEPGDPAAREQRGMGDDEGRVMIERPGVQQRRTERDA